MIKEFYDSSIIKKNYVTKRCYKINFFYKID